MGLFAQQKAMEHCSVRVEPHDVAFGVDSKSLGGGGTGKVDGGERIPAQQKAMEACSVRVEPDNVAFVVDPLGLGDGSTGEADGGETGLVCTTTVNHANGKQQG